MAAYARRALSHHARGSKTVRTGATVKLSFRTIPQVRQTWAYNYVHSRFRTKGKAKDFDLAVPSAAHAINEWGVAIASTSIYKGKVDGDQPDGVDFFDINRLVPERCKTAEAGAKLIGEMIGKYGYPSRAKDNDHGQVWVVADPHGAWVVECGGGRHWVARKIREDFYNCSNAPTITNAFDRGSEVVRYALDKGWIDKPEEFDWSRHFAAGAYQWKKRLAAVRNYLTAPDRFGRITPDTIKKMLRGRGRWRSVNPHHSGRDHRASARGCAANVTCQGLDRNAHAPREQPFPADVCGFESWPALGTRRSRMRVLVRQAGQSFRQGTRRV